MYKAKMIVQLFIITLYFQIQVTLEESTTTEVTDEPQDSTTPEIQENEHDNVAVNENVTRPFRCYKCIYSKVINVQSIPQPEFEVLLAEYNDLGTDTRCERQPDAGIYEAETCGEGVTKCVSKFTEVEGLFGLLGFQVDIFKRGCGDVNTSDDCSTEPDLKAKEYFESTGIDLLSYNQTTCPCAQGANCEAPLEYEPVSTIDSSISCYECAHSKVVLGMGKDFFLDIVLRGYTDAATDMFCASNAGMYRKVACPEGVNSCYYGTTHYTGKLNGVAYKVEKYSRGCAEPGDALDLCITEEKDIVPDYSEGDSDYSMNMDSYYADNANSQGHLDLEKTFQPTDLTEFRDVCLCSSDTCNTPRGEEHIVHIRDEPLHCYTCSFVEYTINGATEDEIGQNAIGPMLAEAGAVGNDQDCQSNPGNHATARCSLEVHACNYDIIMVSTVAMGYMNIDVRMHMRSCGNNWDRVDTCKQRDEETPLKEIINDLNFSKRDLRQNFTTCHCSEDRCLGIPAPPVEDVNNQGQELENEVVMKSDEVDDANNVDITIKGENTTGGGIQLAQAAQKAKQESVASCVQVSTLLPMLSVVLALILTFV